MSEKRRDAALLKKYNALLKKAGDAVKNSHAGLYDLLGAIALNDGNKYDGLTDKANDAYNAARALHAAVQNVVVALQRVTGQQERTEEAKNGRGD